MQALQSETKIEIVCGHQFTLWQSCKDYGRSVGHSLLQGPSSNMAIVVWSVACPSSSALSHFTVTRTTRAWMSSRTWFLPYTSQLTQCLPYLEKQQVQSTVNWKQTKAGTSLLSLPLPALLICGQVWLTIFSIRWASNRQRYCSSMTYQAL